MSPCAFEAMSSWFLFLLTFSVSDALHADLSTVKYTGSVGSYFPSACHQIVNYLKFSILFVSLIIIHIINGKSTSIIHINFKK